MFGADKGTLEAGSRRLNGKDLKIGIVQARFNEPITDALAQAWGERLSAVSRRGEQIVGEEDGAPVRH